MMHSLSCLLRERVGVRDLKMRKHYKRKEARDLRKTMTDAEKKLWYWLRDRRFYEVKFRRQYPIGVYIADFASLEPPLVIELDGGQHATNQMYDTRRDAFLRQQGFTILRFWNNDVISNVEGVLTMIAQQIQNALGAKDSPHPDPLPQEAGEGMTACHG